MHGLFEIWDRLKSPLPTFWKRMLYLMAGIGASSFAILQTPDLFPADLIELARYGMAIGAVGVALSGLTKKDTPEKTDEP
jgi:hypothetical protein